VLLDLRVRRRRHLEAGEAGGEFGDEADQLDRGVTEAIGQPVVGEVAHVPAEGLDERLIGDGQVLVAPAGHDEGAVSVDPAGDLGGQSGLADPRLAEQPEDRRPLSRRVVDHRPGQLQLREPAHEPALLLGPQFGG
jgi:hypothetical protein